MTEPVAPTELERFRAAIAVSTGMLFAADRSALLVQVLMQRLRATRRNLDDYLGTLSPRSTEAAELAKLLTVSETYFLRNIEQFRVVATYVQEIKASLDKRLRILSAGCSSGDEAYSAAILVRENLPDLRDWSVAIRGVDLNPDVLKKAALAQYSTWSLRETPVEIRDRYFARAGGGFALNESVRSMVAFEQHNLVDPDPTLWRPQSYHLVFCRNVLMYLTMKAAEAIIARIATALVPGGLLFLGHAENVRGLSHDFRLRHSHGTFYYERRDSSSLRSVSQAPRTRPAAEPVATEVGDLAWFEAIGKSSARVTALSAQRAALETPSDAADDAGPASGPVNTTTNGALMGALELVGDERFADALETLAALPPPARNDPDALLLKAVLLTCGGQPSAAEEVCTRLLTLDELNAAAHYVMALCREHAGDVERAIHHDQTSIYLDAEFAMPRLHLGRLLRRRGDHFAARRELDAAVSLLGREDVARIMLFGGGFTREGLIALCRAEQDACAHAA